MVAAIGSCDAVVTCQVIMAPSTYDLQDYARRARMLFACICVCVYACVHETSALFVDPVSIA